jgi:serine/threonine protein kinase
MSASRIVVRGIPYRVEGEIGHGLHSLVYSARDLRDGRPVAIKVINFLHGSIAVKADTESRRQSFWKEIEMLLYLQSLNPYIIRVFNHDHNDQHGIIVMERGGTFRDTLVKHLLSSTPMPMPLIHQYWSQMVEAIYYMHQIGIVHGDCKPENFIQVGPGGKTLRLIDMGISFQLPANMTSRLKTAAGTPGRLDRHFLFFLFCFL